MKRTLTLFAALFALGTAGSAQHMPHVPRIDPREVVMRVELIQKQESEINAKRSFGERDTTTKHKRALRIECRLLGSTFPKPATLHWYFVGRDPTNGKIAVYGSGEHATYFGNLQTVIFGEAPELEESVSHRSEGTMRIKSKTGVRPHGWAVLMKQEGRVVASAESVQGIVRMVEQR